MTMITQQTRSFFDSKHFSEAASITIISNVSNEPLALGVVK